eukprot:SAG31_NODE_724_length_12555_cov_11.624277_1_plen_162_part_10
MRPHAYSNGNRSATRSSKSSNSPTAVALLSSSVLHRRRTSAGCVGSRWPSRGGIAASAYMLLRLQAGTPAAIRARPPVFDPEFDRGWLERTATKSGRARRIGIRIACLRSKPRFCGLARGRLGAPWSTTREPDRLSAPHRRPAMNPARRAAHHHACMSRSAA